MATAQGQERTSIQAGRMQRKGREWQLHDLPGLSESEWAMAPDKHPGNGIDRHGNSATPAPHQNKYIDYTEKWGPFRMRTVRP